jgi:DNA-binding GntR family transcriptional regulator
MGENGTIPAQPAQRSMTEDAYERIQHMIVTGRLAPYQLLSENDLARELGLGRTPVREALQRLKFEGFVEVMPRRGVLVAPIDVTRQLDLLETRRPLEAQMIRLATRRATAEERAEMIRLAEGLLAAIEAGDRDSYLVFNKAIHEIEAQAAHNPFLRQQMAVLHNLSRRFWFSVISDTGRFRAAAELHARTLRAIVAGDEAGAVAACEALLDVLEASTRAAVERRDG